MKEIILLTGEAGAGKSAALKHLEDLGFYCIDNIPPDLIPEFIRLIEESREIEKAALAVDMRNPKFRESAPSMIKSLKERYPIKVWYFTADRATLLKRFKETRRPHPFQRYFQNESLERLIDKEKELYLPVKALADRVIDTTRLTVHDLKRDLRAVLENGRTTLQITFLSFGFKNGLPQLADNIFDVRFLPNPYFVDSLKEKSGLDKEVRDYVMSFPESRETFEKIYSFVRFTIPLYEREGKAYITYAVGCTGGQHRSVALARLLSEEAAKEFNEYEIFVEHRELGIRERVSSRPSP